MNTWRMNSANEREGQRHRQTDRQRERGGIERDESKIEQILYFQVLNQK